MKLSGENLLKTATVLLLASLDCAATPPDYTARNQAFSPANTSSPAAARPEQTPIVPDRRTPSSRSLPPASDLVAARRAPIEVAETRGKPLLSPAVQPPARRTLQPVTLERRSAGLTPSAGAFHPAAASRFQSQLGARQGVTIGRTPVVNGTAPVELNRFVFQRTAPATVSAPAQAVRAGGRAPDRTEPPASTRDPR